MPLRRPTGWLVRGVLLTLFAGLGGAVWYAQTWVSPENVRAALVSSLQDHFPGANVTVGGARLSVFGGITVSDLAVSWPGDSEPFFAAPSAVIEHDKQRLNQGRLGVRKIELDRPTLRLECTPEGVWRIPGLERETPADRPVPTFVVRGATVTVIDRRPGGWPAFAVRDASFELVNDPLPVLKVRAGATVAPFGSVQVAATFHRETKVAAVRLDVPDVVLGPAFAAEIAKARPDVAEWLDKLSASATLRADLTYQPGQPRPMRADVKLDVRDGRYDDPALPWPMEKLSATVRVVDGTLRVERATARVGPATADLAFETLPLPALVEPLGESAGAALPTTPDLFGAIEQRLVSVTATLKNLALTDDLFARLPPAANAARARLHPTGAVDATYKFARVGGTWKREIEVRPNQLAILYDRLRYPISELDGSIRKTVTPDGADDVTVRVTGTAGGKRVDISGRVAGGGDDPLIDLRIAGDDLTIDKTLFDSLHKEKYRTLLNQLRARGRGDFSCTIRQDPGVNRVETTFAVTVKDGTLCDERFPYPLDRVRGKIVVRVVTSDESRPDAPGTYKPSEPDPDRVDILGFTARHGDGTVWLDGANEVVPGTRDRRLILSVKAKDCPLDDALAKAVAALRVGPVWDTFKPRGTLTLGVDVTVADRAGLLNADGSVGVAPDFDPDRDLKLTVNFKGPTVTPDFFPYELGGLAGLLRYEGRGVDLLQFTATHGTSRLTLEAGQVRFRPDGTVWANLGGVAATPLVPDRELLAALPPGLAKAVAELNPRGPIDLSLRHLVVLAPPATPPEPQSMSVSGRRGPSPDPARAPAASSVYWDGQVTLAGAALDAGTTWDDLRGTIACRGRSDGDRLTGAVGTVWLDTGTAAKQPVSRVKVAFATDPPDAGPIRLRFTDLHGKCFRGELGGEARVVLTDPPQYRLWLTAHDVRIEDVAAFHQVGRETEFSGLAQGKLVLDNEPDPKTGEVVLRGEGSVDVPTGKMYRLPVLLELIKVAKLQTPDQTGFEEAHATFRVRGDRIVVDKLDLLGSAVSLGGSGELDADAKDVKFEFYTIWSQTLKRWLTTPLGDPTAALSDKLFRIEATRTNGGDFKFTPRVVPAVTDPFRAVAERFRTRAGPTVRAAGQ
jgi:hypothetical protein